MVRKIAEKGYIFLMLGVLYAPILMIIIYSFSNTNNFTFPEGFTFEAYSQLFTNAPKKLWDSLLNTIIIAVVSSVPCAEHDAVMDWIITPAGRIACRGTRTQEDRI